MRIRHLYVCLIILAAGISSCIEEYWPDVSNYQNLMVIDGAITDQPGPYTVKVSRSTDISNPKNIPFPGCEVAITDDLGNTETLIETEIGTYQTSTEGIRGVIGRKYMLSVKTPDGELYESDYSTLKTSVGIDSVFGIIEKKHPNNPEDSEIGYQFYVNTKAGNTDSTFILWRLFQTYEYHADFTIDFLWVGRFVRFHDPDTLFYCWKTEQIPEIFTYNTLGLQEPIIYDYPLNYVGNGTKKLSVRYSLLVEQYTIDYKSQEYFKELMEQNADHGTLYAKQPHQIRGNLTNTNNPGEIVLGYFMVGSKTSKRIFVNRPNIDFNYGVCIPDTDPRGFVYWPSRYWPIYAYLTDDGLYAHGADACFDCTLKGGTTEKPEFWTYE